MRAHAILILGLAALMVAPDASAQSFKEKLKKATEEVGQQIKQEVKQQIKQEASKRAPEKTPAKSAAKPSVKKTITVPSSQGSSQPAGGQATTVKLPEIHNALFAPLGAPADPKQGVKSSSVTRPPKEDAKQPDWNDARPYVDELDNKSLIEEFVLLNECLNSGYIDSNSPVAIRYFNQVQREFTNRMEVLERMVEYYDQTKTDYVSDYGLDAAAVNDNNHRMLASILKQDVYKRTVRSSLAPFFELKIKDGDSWFTCFNEETRKYFAEHGGYEDAHKKMTIWDPDALPEK